jgi:hypothetical protein
VDRVAETTAGEVQARADVGGFQVGLFLDNLVHAEAVRQQVEDVANPNTHAPNSGPAAALLRIDGDPFVEEGHGSNSKSRYAEASGLRSRQAMYLS